MVPAPAGAMERDMHAWVNYIGASSIPVLKLTAREISRLKEDEDSVSSRAISTVVLNDPLMSFKVLVYAQKRKSKNQLQDLAEVEQAIMMMGTSTFFRNVLPVPLVEDLLKSNLPALMHLLKLIRRSHRAAKFAVDWAGHLMDLHAEEVFVAAMLHDLSEMLMWCYAPEKMNAIFTMQHADKTLRSTVAQQEVLGFNLHALQMELVKAYKLPPLLSKLMQDEVLHDRRVKNVRLAVNLARHSANGWDDAALPDDYHEIAALLRMDIEKTMRIIGVPTDN